MVFRTNGSRARRYVRGRGNARAIIAVALLLALIGFHAYQSRTAKPPSPLTGRARVVDGDSMEISGARIRLQGIDAPEWEQTCSNSAGETWACGKVAAQELSRHVAARDLRCEPGGVDRYHRILATCFGADGSDINAWMVRQGWAVAYGNGRNYRAEQNEAQADKRGIWTGLFLPPEEWRQRHPHASQ
jgi:endonuclease YncB( thermonuclease family)